MVEAGLDPPRTIALPSGWSDPSYRPWVEVTVAADTVLPEWGLAERIWLHWAVPVRDGRLRSGEARRFDPGRRSAVPGEPESARRGETFQLRASEVGPLATGLLAREALEVHRLTPAGPLSAVGESLRVFRHRCLRLLGPVVSADAGSPEQTAAELGALVGGIESRRLDAGALRPIVVRARVGWYPAPLEPQIGADDLMTSGGVRTEAR